MIPVVIEQTSRGERSYDIYSRLLKDRINSYSLTPKTILKTFTSMSILLVVQYLLVWRLWIQ